MGGQQKTAEIAVELLYQNQVAMSKTLEQSRITLGELHTVFRQTISGLSSATNAMVGELHTSMRAVTDQRGLLLGTAEDAQRAREQMAQDLESSRTAVIEVERAMAEMARAIAVGLAGDRS